MRCVKDRVIDRRGTTLVELTVAVAIVAVVFAAVMPLFAAIRNSADARWAGLEMVQNARVLNEQLCRSLAAAKRITAVSDDTSDDGYIQFETANGVVHRCDLAEDGWVRFGPVDDLKEFVGPLDSLRFVCYDDDDMDHPTDLPGAVRLVTWEARLPSSGSLARARTVRGACCLRAATHEKEVVVTCDFGTRTPGKDCVAFADQAESQIPDQSAVPALPVESDQWALIALRDGKSHVLSVGDDSQFAQVRMTFAIDQEPADVGVIAVAWIGRGRNAHAGAMDGATLYLWNYGASAYERIQASADTEEEVTLAGSGASPAAKYLGGATGKTVVLLIVSNDRKWGTEENMLCTDYAKVDVTVTGGAAAFGP